MSFENKVNKESSTSVFINKCSPECQIAARCFERLRELARQNGYENGNEFNPDDI